jgi:uncharacterized lipoprotein
MRTRKIFYLVSFLIIMLLISACSTSNKGRKSSKRYYRERCDCSRFSEMVKNETVLTSEWAMRYGGQNSTE